VDIRQLSEEMTHFVASRGWFETGSPRPQTPRNIATSLVVEAAEMLEHFQWGEQSVDKSALAGELADVLLYLLELASVTGIDLERAALDKLKVNYGRTWE